MDGSIAFFQLKNKVCVGEFKCEGKILNLQTSSDKKEVFVYADSGKLYRIFINQALHFMKMIPNSNDSRCFLPIHPHDDPTNQTHYKNDDGRISKILFANNRFTYVDSADIKKQTKIDEIQFEPGMIVYKMKLDCHSHVVFAIIGHKGQKAKLHSIDIKKGKLLHVFDQEIRTDSKMLLCHKKGLILEPFKSKRIYEFPGKEMTEIDIDYDIDHQLWTLDDFEKSESNNLLMILCEKKVENKLIKFIKLHSIS